MWSEAGKRMMGESGTRVGGRRVIDHAATWSEGRRTTWHVRSVPREGVWACGAWDDGLMSEMYASLLCGRMR